MSTLLTIWIAKLIILASRLTGRGGGSALPGLVAERLYPQVGSVLAGRIPHGSIIITGTNGKTTTAKMAAQIFGANGTDLITNRAGSNLSRGIVSALIDHAGWDGQMRGELGMFEVDEAALPAVTAMVQPKTIIVLNLFRDQLDRYGELDTTASLIGTAIASCDAEIILNADDPLVASLSKYARPHQKIKYFGLDDAPVSRITTDITADSIDCPVCGRRLAYEQVFFGHIGHYKCPHGDFARPRTDYSASQLKLSETGAEFQLHLAKKSAAAKLYLPGTYNVYNAVAAAAFTDAQGVSMATIVEALPTVTAAFGRVERVAIEGKIIYLLLVKNPTGFNQIIQTFLLQKDQHVLLAINDLFADGRDVSWLWDVSFEELKSMSPHICVTGIRAADMALRLKYAEVAVDETNPDMAEALSTFISNIPEGGTGYIAPTYTAMRAIRQALGKKVALKGEWE